MVGIIVSSRSSLLEFRDTDRNVKRISRELAANWVVDGSYQRFGDGIRLTVTLIDSHSDCVIWSDPPVRRHPWPQAPPTAPHIEGFYPTFAMEFPLPAPLFFIRFPLDCCHDFS
jgi:hypothetical protein